MFDSYFHHDVSGHGAGVTLPRSMRVDLFFFFFFFCDFPTDFPLLFSLCLSLLIFLFIGHLSHILFWPCLITEASRAFEKRLGSSRFSELNFSSFFRHLNDSGVLQVCDPGLTLRTYKVTVLAHTKKSTLTESVNK